MVVNLEERLGTGLAGELQVTVSAYRHKRYGGNCSRYSFSNDRRSYILQKPALVEDVETIVGLISVKIVDGLMTRSIPRRNKQWLTTNIMRRSDIIYDTLDDQMRSYILQ